MLNGEIVIDKVGDRYFAYYVRNYTEELIREIEGDKFDLDRFNNRTNVNDLLSR